MFIQKLSRRQLLVLGGTAVLAGLGARAQPAKNIRIGLVVPNHTGLNQVASMVYEAAGDLARRGAIMAGDEIGQKAELMGFNLKVLPASAPTADAAKRAAERLIVTEKVFALVGGVGTGQAEVLAEVAEERKVLFFNVGSPSPALRGANCGRYTFHIEASAAMYLDALADWFVRSSFRRWYFVYPKTPEGQALYARMIKALTMRHWGASEAGKSAVTVVQPDFSKELEDIRKSKADVVMLLLGAEDQSNFFGQYELSGLNAQVTAFPDPVSQTRDYYSAMRVFAPHTGAGYRATLWEPTLDVYGARKLNSRFAERWGQTMDASAWASYVSVKILFEAASAAQTVDPSKLVGYFEKARSVFDIYKGKGTSFRPWDHQLRQSLYLVKLNAKSKPSVELSDRIAMANLVGELPTIYKPSIVPSERLDQLGDLKRDSSCRFK